MHLIETKITAIEGVRIYFDYFIYNDNQKLIASAMTILVFIDAISKKPVPPPKELLSIIQSYAIQEQ
jgi:acyl-CoA thioester hydrolase